MIRNLLAALTGRVKHLLNRVPSTESHPADRPGQLAHTSARPANAPAELTDGPVGGIGRRP